MLLGARRLSKKKHALSRICILDKPRILSEGNRLSTSTGREREYLTCKVGDKASLHSALPCFSIFEKIMHRSGRHVDSFSHWHLDPPSVASLPHCPMAVT